MTAISTPTREPIAIVGIGCRFPGGVNNPTRYWELLASGQDATCEVPDDRWEKGKFYDPEPGKLGKMSTFRGGFLQNIDGFDAHFFGISPREAIWLDPQQRLLLMSAWEALEDAGADIDAMAGTRTGVFVGGFTLDYKLLQNYGVQSRYELQAHSATGMMMTMLSNRLSFAFDFRGPSLSVDTACSGSLVAVHLASQAIWNGECDTALAGGVNVMLAPNMTIAESKGGFLAPDGRCKTFSAAANGYARGEGAGVVVLKPLSAAIDAGDDIYATVNGSAVTQDGHTSGITVPNGEAQMSAMSAAYQRAGIQPEQVQYIEAHGTGTPVGDPIEAAAIGQIVGTCRDTSNPVVVGSAKTNIGHLEAAAGIAGLIKAALAIKHAQIPGNLHFTQPNPAIAFDKLNIVVPTGTRNWPEPDKPRIAGVNSFGFGGTNAHVILAEAPPFDSPRHPVTDHPTSHEKRPLVLPLSARCPEALSDLASSTANLIESSHTDLSDIAHSLVRRRTHHEYRLAVTATHASHAVEQLRAAASDEAAAGIATGRVPEQKRKLAFVCTGMGPQWWGMGRDLLRTESVFRAEIERCDRELAKYTGWSLLDEMTKNEQSSRMEETEVAQTANFAVQIGLAALWKSWGIEPDAIVGHSTGEVAAQYLAGVLTFEDAIKVNYYRSSLQQRVTGTGRMLAVGLTAETLHKAVADAGPLVSVAAVNGPNSVTLAGDADALQSMADQLDTFGVFHKFLQVKVPYHSHYMDPIRDDLMAGLSDLTPRRATIPLYSTVTGTRLEGPSAGADYWWQNVRATVLFQSAFTQMVEDGFDHFLEIGPHPVLAGAMRETLAALDAPDALIMSSMRRGVDEPTQIRQALSSLHCHAHTVNWAVVNGPGHYTKLPTYPWQTKSYWNESREASEDRHFIQIHPLLGQAINAPHPTWEREMSANQLPFLADHAVQGNVVLPAACFIEMALAAGRDAYGSESICVQDLALQRALLLTSTADPRVRTTLQTTSGSIEFTSLMAHPSGARTWSTHVTARISAQMNRKAALDTAPFCEPTADFTDQTTFYALTDTMGFQYGPAFQTVESVSLRGDTAVGAIRVPDEISDDLDDFTFHPCLIDAAFQVLICAAAQGLDQETANPYLPVGVDKVTVLGPPQSRMMVVATISERDAFAMVSDISVCDSAGNVLLQIDGFRAQNLEHSENVTLERVDAGLLEATWNTADPVPEDKKCSSPSDTWLILTDSYGLGSALSERIDAAGATAITVRRDLVDALTREGPNAYALNPHDEAQYQALLRDLTENAVSRIVHLWGLDSTTTEDESGIDILAKQETTSLSLLHLMQGISAHATQLPHVWVVTRGAIHHPSDSGPVNAAAATLWGLGRVVGHQEFTSMWGGLIDLDPTFAAIGADCDLLLREINADDSEDQVAYRAGERFVLRLRPVQELGAPVPKTIREDATYLITGGVGALGLVMARTLSSHGAKHLVLTGRSSLPAPELWPDLDRDHPQARTVSVLHELTQAGTNVEYVELDVTDAEALHAWHTQHQKDGRPPVAGVLHVAGTVADQLILKMERSSFVDVLRPKLVGAWNLHRQFHDTPLDMFVLFSSTGSVIASAGQANYAAANAFLDALAQYRTALGLPGLSIGWGPWSVGMVEDLDLESMYTRRGIELITPALGSQTLLRLIGQPHSHLVAITADWTKARKSGLGGALPAMFQDLGQTESQTGDGADDSDQLLPALAVLDPASRAQRLTQYLTDIVSQVMSLDKDALRPDELLGGLGMDSMMAIEVKHRVEAALGVEVSVLDLIQGATLATLGDRLLEQVTFPGSPTSVPGPDHPSADAEISELLEQLTPDELEQLLTDLDSVDGDAPSLT